MLVDFRRSQRQKPVRTLRAVGTGKHQKLSKKSIMDVTDMPLLTLVKESPLSQANSTECMVGRVDGIVVSIFF